MLPHGFVSILFTNQLYSKLCACTTNQIVVSKLLIADLFFDLLAPDSCL